MRGFYFFFLCTVTFKEVFSWMFCDMLVSHPLYFKSSSTLTWPRKALWSSPKFTTSPSLPTLPSVLKVTSSSVSIRVLPVCCNTMLLARLLPRLTRVSAHINLPVPYSNLSPQGTAQVLLRWAVQQGLAVIPKSNNHDRLLSNLDVVAWSLSDEDMKAISALNINLRVSTTCIVSSDVYSWSSSIAQRPRRSWPPYGYLRLSILSMTCKYRYVVFQMY